MTPPRLSTAGLLDALKPDVVVYMPGATGELVALHDVLASDPGRLRRVKIVSCLVPGMNGFDYAALHPDARMTTFLLPPGLRGSFERGRVEVLPLPYTAIAAHLDGLEPDIALLHLTPPVDGLCSFGVCADFGPIVAKSAKRRIGVINPLMPRPTQGPEIAFDSLDAVMDLEAAIPAIRPEETSAEMSALARQVAALIPDGAVLQTGIGAAPAAVWKALGGHCGLRLHSGMVTDGFLEAAEAGAMAPGGHRAGIAYGSRRLYDALNGSDLVAFADTFTTHGAAALAPLDRFTSVNSALEVDLFGQANLEWRGDRLISGVGGAPDFVRAARLSRGGRSIIALPATAKGGALSRITLRLTSPASITRADIDTVVTEHGVAELSALSMDDRAERLIAIAAPQHRPGLTTGWIELRRAM